MRFETGDSGVSLGMNFETVFEWQTGNAPFGRLVGFWPSLAQMIAVNSLK